MFFMTNAISELQCAILFLTIYPSGVYGSNGKIAVLQRDKTEVENKISNAVALRDGSGSLFFNPIQSTPFRLGPTFIHIYPH